MRPRAEAPLRRCTDLGHERGDDTRAAAIGPAESDRNGRVEVAAGAEIDAVGGVASSTVGAEARVDALPAAAFVQA